MNNEHAVITETWCRKCSRMRPVSNFYSAVDLKLIDSNGYFSVCKDCVQDTYDFIFEKTQSIEKTIHKLCVSLNIKFSNEAVASTKTHINTLIENGKNVNAVFSIYKMKLFASQKSMDKSIEEDMSYEDFGTVYVSEIKNIKEVPIPENVIKFWGKDVSREDIEYLETEYANFKQTHSADTYAEIVLLKQVCYTLLNIKKLRLIPDSDTKKEVKELQELMKNLAISPNNVSSPSGEKGSESFGLWIQDIEKDEPAQWLKTDPRGDMYRDVGNVEEYFQKYFVRPLKNFITMSRDFNVDDETGEDLVNDEESTSEFTYEAEE